MPSNVDSLPLPDAAARAHSERVTEALARAIARAGGWVPFERWMHEALYAPGLGYYVAGARKFGAAGDFITAPELTPLFARALAVQVGAIVAPIAGDVLELGAGSGRLAADLVAALVAADVAPSRYRIVEVSPELRERQRVTIAQALPDLVDRFEWLDDLPESVQGAVVMNEVLDAIPVHLIARLDQRWWERGVAQGASGFRFEDRPLAENRLRALAQTRFPPSDDYVSEINVRAEALVEALATRLTAGAILVIDYGFPQREYYHPQRSSGTLMAHYRHHALADPFLWPGLCDITAHIDFTAMAEAGVSAGVEVAGFASQAAFLLNCGILERLRAVAPVETLEYLRESSAVQKLLSPAEMGELFKVLALAKGDGIAWPGFARNDMRHRL